jgi:hypothetical protein
MSLIKAQGAGDASTGFYDYTINQSLRFPESTGGGYLSKETFGSTGGDWTWSGWVKRSTIGAFKFLFVSSSQASTYVTAGLGFTNTDKLWFFQFSNAATYTVNVQSTAVFRDTSAWYHVVATYDEDGNVVLYVNGTQVASGSTSSTYRTINKTTYPHYIGNRTYQSNPGGDFHGYMAEINFVDGSLLAPSNFGETKTGIWVPKEYSGSHGNNGFYLPFDDSSAIGDDESANTNDFSVTSLTADDVVVDSPTNNHSVFNVLDAETLLTFTEGNLALSYSGNSARSLARSSIKMPASTDAFFELKMTSNLGGGVDMAVGIEDGSAKSANDSVVFANAYIIREDGSFYDQNSSGSYGVSFTNNDVIGVWRKANGDLVFYKNGTAMNSGTPAKTGLTGEFHFVAGPFNGASCIARFAADQWTNTPSGVDSTMSLCADNLPDPGIDPAQDEEPADFFNTVLYSGNSSTNNVTGAGLQPDWVWLKNRSSGSTAHRLYDSVRGPHKVLFSSADNSEFTESGWGLDSFDSDGFTLLHDNTNKLYFNQTGQNYVAWNWKVNGGSTSNVSAGASSNIRLIGGGTADQAAVQANTQAGISIVSFENTARGASDFLTFPHGLGAEPEMVWVKSRDSSNYFAIYHAGAGLKLGFLGSNSTFGAAAWITSTFWNAVNDTTVKFQSNGNIAATNEDIIAYCFRGIEGYSKFGSYTGNANADGVFVYTGFRPAFVIRRPIAAGNWTMADNRRNGFNDDNDPLYANAGNAEASSGDTIDFLSNGFKMRSSDTGANPSATVIYMAFAEQPFKYSNAR